MALSKDWDPVADALPDDRVFRRVHAHSAFGDDGRFDLYLVEFNKNIPCWNSEGNYTQPQPIGGIVTTVSLDAGCLPAVAMNQVYQGKNRVRNDGLLPTERFWAQVGSGEVETLERVGLNREQYPRRRAFRFDLSNVAVYKAEDRRGREVKLIIPCLEVLRLFYTPNSRFVHALVDFPYGEGISDLLNLEKSTLDGADLELCLRTKMSEDRMTVLCAALFALDSIAKDYVKQIFLSNKKGKYFSALIPSPKPTLWVEGQMLEVRGAIEPTYLLLRLTKTENPLPPDIREIKYWREFGGKAGDIVLEDSERLPRTAIPINTLPAMIPTTDPDIGADGSSQTFVSAGDDAVWENTVTTSKISPKASTRYKQNPRAFAGEVKDDSSTRNPAGEGKGAPEVSTTVDAEPTEIKNDRLTNCLVGLEALSTRDCDAIDFEIAEPQTTDVAWKGWRLWPFIREDEDENRLPWAWLSAGKLHPRGALVLQVSLPGTELPPIFWIELACRKSEKFHSFLICPLEDIATCMGAFAKYCAHSKPTCVANNKTGYRCFQKTAIVSPVNHAADRFTAIETFAKEVQELLG